MWRATGFCLVVLGAVIAACSSSDSDSGGDVPPAPPTGHPTITLDELETQFLAGIDETPVIVSEQRLDQDFPLVERLTKPERQLVDGDPTKGGKTDVDAAFDAFTPTESADDHFTIDVMETGVTQANIDRVKKGLLFGMARWDAYNPGFSVTTATSAKAGNKPFKVSIKTTKDPGTEWRAYVSPCGASAEPDTIEEIVADIEGSTCLPRMVIPIEPMKPVTDYLSPFIFVHEMAHVAQDYWQAAPAYLAAGGIKNASAYHQGFGWQFESDAEFSGRHAPEAYGYDSIFGGDACPFEPMRRGALSWNSTSAIGADNRFPYEMGLFLDQITWHRFAKDPSWIYQWFTALVDPRSQTTPPIRPYTPTRRLMRVVSKDPNKTDISSFNRVLAQAGMDLYFRGKNPWTTRQLRKDCIRNAVTVDLPLLSFDALRVDPGDLSDVAKLRISLEVSRDPTFINAAVAAVELDDAGVPKFIDCVKAITEGGLGNADPRAGCMQDVVPLGVLNSKNEFKDEIQLPITFKGHKYAIVALVAHTMGREDAQRATITVVFHAEPVSTPPGNRLAKEQCGALTEAYRSHCKTSDCFCIGNAYCEGTVDHPPTSCENAQRECYIFCLFQKGDCDCTSYCDRLYATLGCH